MQKEYLLALSFEVNCSNEDVQQYEICEFSAILLNSVGVNVAEFRTFVKPVLVPYISPFIHGLTGITDDDIKTGVSWEEALNMFDMWCQKNSICSENTMTVIFGDQNLKTLYPHQLAITDTANKQSQRVKELFAIWCNVEIIYTRQKKIKSDPILQDVDLSFIYRQGSGFSNCRGIRALCKYLIEHGMLGSLLHGTSACKKIYPYV